MTQKMQLLTPNIRLNDKLNGHHDNFKTHPTYNTDGMGNCLKQPGQLINRPVKSMRVTLFPLIIICVP